MAVTHHTIYFTEQLRALWPRPLARRWRAEYPGIFDKDDLRLTQTQPSFHFPEWFTAVYLFQREGVLSLVEKYGCDGTHKGKPPIVTELLGRREDAFWRICKDCGVQPPDLLVYAPDRSRFWFAEAKGPGDSLSEKQRRSHALLSHQLRVLIEVYDVVQWKKP